MEMQGFKSFPEHIKVDFQKGLTAIVGPNGSGKSNITDAIRWVLGEQNARVLRGGNMEDVIFNGTATRKKLACAEVSLHLDNRKKTFDLDYETVVVSRKYYRSGESEYLINGKTCRLKDINELFADTGIGRDGYSIIGQGKVDELLSGRSDDRRKIFEEAAGIVKYKMRKQESERKMGKAETNLLRIHDILQEVRERIGPLEKQVKEAEKYNVLSDEIRKLDLYLSISKLTEEEVESKNLLDYLDSLSDDIQASKNNKEEIYRQRQLLRQKEEERNVNEDSIRSQHKEISKEFSLFAEQMALANERQRAHKQRLSTIETLLENLERGQKDTKSKINARQEEIKRLETKEQEKREEVIHYEKELSEVEKFLDEEEIAENLARQNIDKIRQELFQMRSLSFKTQSEEARLNAQIDESKSLLEDTESEHKELQEELSELTETYKEKIRQKTSCYEELQLCDRELEKAKQNIIQIEKRKMEALSEINEHAYRYKTLRDLEENREGYHSAVKAIAREAELDKNFALGLCGTVAELIKVPPKYEIAIEVALGSTLQNLVTESARDASRLIEWLKKERAGRETFLPLDEIEGRVLSDSDYNKAASCNGFLATADEVIEVDPKHSALLTYLGGRLIIASTLNQALEISRLLGKRHRIVSLEGDLVNPGGSMTGGSSKHGGFGLLSRKREMEEALDKGRQLNDEVAIIEQKIELGKKSLSEIGQNQADLHEKYKIFERELVAIEERIKSKNERDTELKDRISQEKMRLQQLEESIKKGQEAVQSSEGKIISLENEVRKIEEELQSFDGKFTEQKEKVENLRELLADGRIGLGTIAEMIRGLKQLSLQLESEEKEQNRQKSELIDERASLHEEVQELKKLSVEREDAKAKAEEKASELEKRLAKLNEERLKAKKLEDEFFHALESITRREQDLLREMERSQGQINRFKDKRKTEINRLWESYKLSFQEALEEYTKIEISDSLSKVESNLRKARNAIRQLPAINHSAPEEYNELKERLDFMEKQEEDLLHTKIQLHRVIGDLEDSMREQFAEKLRKINENFQISFRELFNGGHAELIVGEGDLLDCSIDIKAQPPGKRLQSLSLLSGGERAMTAIAVLFAIFNLSPAPFCILDEVESALDDANVYRFTAYLKRYVEDTQFILVTHRKGTMEAADQLYGVSMKEKGISTLLSMRLEDAVSL